MADLVIATLRIAFLLAGSVFLAAAAILIFAAWQAVVEWRQLPARRLHLTSLVVLVGVLTSLGVGMLIVSAALIWGVA